MPLEGPKKAENGSKLDHKNKRLLNDTHDRLTTEGETREGEKPKIPKAENKEAPTPPNPETQII